MPTPTSLFNRKESHTAIKWLDLKTTNRHYIIDIFIPASNRWIDLFCKYLVHKPTKNDRLSWNGKNMTFPGTFFSISRWLNDYFANWSIVGGTYRLGLFLAVLDAASDAASLVSTLASVESKTASLASWIDAVFSLAQGARLFGEFVWLSELSFGASSEDVLGASIGFSPIFSSESGLESSLMVQAQCEALPRWVHF